MSSAILSRSLNGKATTGPRSERVLVTPELAAEWLASNRDNRTLRRSDVEFLKSMMVAGNFYCTHQGIAFYVDGTLADGQHRLQAIVECGIAQWMVVFHGLGRDALHGIDRGRTRSMTDTMRFMGQKVDNARVAICTVLIRQHQAQETGKKWDSKRVDSSTFAAYYDGWREAIEFACFPVGARAANAILAGAVASAWFTQDHRRLEDFKVVMGEGFVSHDHDLAAIRLRNLLLSSGARGACSDRNDTFLRCCSALRAFIGRRDLKKIYATTDAAFRIPSPEELNA